MQSAFTVFSENWTLDSRQKRQLEALVDPSTKKFSCLVKEYLDRYRGSLSPSRRGSRTLRQTIARKLRQIFYQTPDIESDVLELFASFENKPSVVEPVFLTLPYAILRASIKIARAHNFSDVAANIAALRDIDQAILAGEEKLRDGDNRGNHNLVSIEDLKTILEYHNNPKSSEPQVSYIRKPVDIRELPLLDEHRPDTIRFLTSKHEFQRHFRSSFPEFEGLNWDNMMVVGDKVLSTFMDVQVPPSLSTSDPDTGFMQIRLFGLSSSEATTKVREIYRVWCSNLPSHETPYMTKTPSCIQFVRPDQDERPIMIPLHVWPTVTDALLEISPDPCAICFDGNQMLMLPRCARAIETGYSIITTRLVFDRSVLNPRTATAMQQLLNYRNRGFGVRTIRVYLQFCEDPDLEPACLRTASAPDVWALKTPQQCPADRFQSLSAYRRIDGKLEKGTKTVRRIAYLGQDRVNHVALGRTPLDADFDPSAPAVIDEPRHTFSNPGGSTIEHSTSGVITSRSDYIRAKRGLVQAIGDANIGLNAHRLNVHCDQRDTSSVSHSFAQVSLNRIQDLGTMPFEAFVRCAEEWTHADRIDQLNPEDRGRYHPGFMLDRHDSLQALSTWDWCQRQNMHYDPELVNWIHQNDETFHTFIKPVVHARITGDYAFGYNGYLTSRVRLMCQNTDADVVFAQKLTVPLLITTVAENELSSMLTPHVIIPICRPEAHLPGSDYTGGIPPVPEDRNELGNMRYISIQPENMWRGFDCQRDQAMEVLYLLAFLTASRRREAIHTSCSDPMLIDELRMMLCHSPAGMLPQHAKDELVPGTMISIREAMLYRAWVMAIPTQSTRTSSTKMSTGAVNDEAGDIDLNYLYPFPDELFWGPELEGDASEEKAAKRAKTSPVLGWDNWRPWWLRSAAYADLDDG